MNRLYGTPGAEVMYSELEDCYETEIEEWREGREVHAYTIEEWTVYPPRHHLPSVDQIGTWMSEWVAEDGEVCEGASEDFDKILGDVAIKSRIEQLLSAIAEKVTCRMAKDKVQDFVITFDNNNEPLIDGAPMYVKTVLL